MVNFAKLTAVEEDAVSDIVGRYLGLHGRARPRSMAPVTQLEVRMDICAVHAHTPLRLEDLATADDFNFSHDLFGIRRHLDRTTGRLTGCFVPRFAR